MQPGQWPALGEVGLRFTDDRRRGGAGVSSVPPRLVVLRPDVLASPTAMPTGTPTASPTTTVTPSAMPPPASATPAVSPTQLPRPVFLPLALREQCVSEQRHADVALVLDASTSMLEPVATGGTKLDTARLAAGTFLDALRLDEGDQAALVAFNVEAVVLQRLTADRRSLDQAFGRIVARSGTRIHRGIDATADELMGARRRAGNVPVLVLLTDGRSNPEPAELAVERSAAAKAAGITVFTIGLGNELDFDALARIASRPEFFYHAPDAAELAAIYAAIAVTVPCPPGAFWGRR